MSKYFDHVTPNDGTALKIGEAIWEKLQSHNVDMEKLLFLGCDGTNVNTGHENGSFYSI